ncbi:hypothetical protein CEUSTIGMA_g10222.t1 [Chlamydomonas eustigma]|uniref:Uncharacterized protein n=1 Tax=Chlamydomonas eustigma TaxID=1157962 RepID=A0A250XIG2_9CHLO|nr:hypothetical protein CEUSTIGMA_g10222.t1 [Chlamydomonas eustigma]|eukprot:GAX82796.1 hypothetical protein CEUSTIGMA_g10222.t1 [Chlamydomonas eustigma]
MSLNRLGSNSRQLSGRGPRSESMGRPLQPSPSQGSTDVDDSTSTDSYQWTIDQNKQILAQLKQENKDLKQELSRRPSTSTRETGRSQSDKTVEKMEKAVHVLRRQYDKIMQEKKTTLSKLSNLQDSMRDMMKATSGSGSTPSNTRPSSAVDSAAAVLTGPASREVRMMENKLEKAALKANEAQSIQRTYEQVIQRMRQEQLSAELHNRAVQESLRAIIKEQERLVILEKEVQHSKDTATQELMAFEEKLESDRLQRERHLNEQRGQAALMQQANAALLKRQYPSLSTDDDGSGEGASTNAWVSGDVTTSDAVASSAMRSGVIVSGSDQGGSIEDPLSKEVHDPASAVRALCRLTGTSSVTGMLGALLPQQASSINLKQMQALAEQQLLQLQAEMELEKSHLEDLHSGKRLTTQSQLDSAQLELKEALQVADDARVRHDEVLKCHAAVIAGLDHLAAMVTTLPAPTGQPPVPLSLSDPDQAVEVVAQCEQRLIKAYKFILSIPKASQILEELSSNPDLDFSFTASASLK